MIPFSKMKGNKSTKFTAMTLVLSLLFSLVLIAPQRAEAAPSYLLSLDRPAYASGSEGNNTPDLAVDGNITSRWSSSWGNTNDWIYVDLGASAQVDRIVLRWEGAYAKSYKIQVSQDELQWNEIHSKVNGTGGIEDFVVNGTGRYVRLQATEKALPQYGISLFEFEIYGTGGVNPPPVALGPNVALNRPVTASSYEQSPYLPPNSTLPQLAVDGNKDTRWSSNPTDDEWIRVDLGSVRTLGRVIIDWEAAAGRIYDIQLSNDGNNWTTIYREMHGDGGTLNLPVYSSGRYLRMKGIARATTFGYSIFEIKAYDYVQGDPRPTYTIAPLPTLTTVPVGQGSHSMNNTSVPQPKYPLYKADNLNAPLPSNDWWQSIMVNKLGNGIITLPLKSKYTKQGLSVLNPGAGYLSADGRAQEAAGSPDLYLMASNINTSAMTNRITGYGDWSAVAVLSDGTAEKLKTTFVKGSPYLFSEFSDPNSPELYLPASVRFFNDQNTEVLAADGSSITADHIGLEITNSNGAPTPAMVKRTYGVFAPPGTTFKKVGSKLKIQLGQGQNYLSLAAIPKTADLSYYHQHAYAFVTDTKVAYSFNETTSDVTTDFNVTTQLKRPGFANTTLMAQLPHQWKVTTTPLTALSYPSIRGTMKVSEGNTFRTVDKFYGIVPQFTEPDDPTYSRQTLLNQLAILDTDTATDLMKADAYWQGKKLHPLAMGVLIADQIGNDHYKNLFLSRMKTILADWYTYTAGESDYFFDYNPDWGTLIYKTSEFGANSGITDHHFTYGYYVFASAVLATFDNDFKNKYSGMVDELIRDYANPSKTDPKYPYMRSFDAYEGHSWAGGYADNDSGNNQEAAGESLFGWVGQYMWSALTGQKNYRDASIMGFTTELNAVKQYWFNYDNDNWLPSYTHKTVGQVYGSSNFFGTFFNGDPVYVYGIHWLPTSEYLTSYGFEKDSAKVAGLYSGFVADNGGVEQDWYHIVWPIQALSDPQAVLNKWNPAPVQQNELFNTYWFVHSMASLGKRSTDIWATNGHSATVYKKGSAYQALIWNPTDAEITVTFRNASGVTGSAKVAAKKLVKVDPTKNTTGNGPTGPNLALNKTATSSPNPKTLARYAFDGDPGTRWESDFSDPQFIQVDLGASRSINYIVLNWEGAFAKSYKIETSVNGISWNQVYATTTGAGGIERLSINATTARYVKLTGTERGTPYGYSLWEFEVYGTGTNLLAAPALKADSAASADSQPVNITFPDSPAWRTAVESIKVDDKELTADQFTISAGQIELDGALFEAAKDYEITVEASGYEEAAVQQPVAEVNTLNLALHKPVTSSPSSVQAAVYAVDGDPGTRWESAYTDVQFIQVDLEAVKTVSRVVLDWEGAYAKAYTIELSVDGKTWTQVHNTKSGKGGLEQISFNPAEARYVRLNGQERGTNYGYSLWELSIY
ncbi:hypothetical protein A8L34_20440 [Bacillus sp. FJAT-27264]|uniref:galactose-binding domain-containing protein n=1 Tax=Paenibacillus sp. (strain DSM 101736 / FJAT-27264) TaxID=1850362 RepID=UPI000807BC78|nr:discoidin domain-containing protein [Bacillus sp. FJAT-27264]OBZ09653.1 hypothetical protein A8L34_20440 [Bacillus sp. FJAT-27264]